MELPFALIPSPFNIPLLKRLPNPLENGIAHCQMVEDELLSDEMVFSQTLPIPHNDRH